MPLKTFQNLSSERQEEIIQVALEEFSRRDFESASLGRIIQKLGLAKGSFYRYFENKIDLYTYLHKVSMESLITQYGHLFTENDKDFFDEWKLFIRAALNLEKESSRHLQFLKKSKDDSKAKELGFATYRNLSARVQHTSRLVTIHQENGALRNDIPIEVICLFIIYIRDAMQDYFNFKFHDKKEIKDISPQEEDEIIREMTHFISLMKEGVGKK